MLFTLSFSIISSQFVLITSTYSQLIKEPLLRHDVQKYRILYDFDLKHKNILDSKRTLTKKVTEQLFVFWNNQISDFNKINNSNFVSINFDNIDLINELNRIDGNLNLFSLNLSENELNSIEVLKYSNLHTMGNIFMSGIFNILKYEYSVNIKYSFEYSKMLSLQNLTNYNVKLFVKNFDSTENIIDNFYKFNVENYIFTDNQSIEKINSISSINLGDDFNNIVINSKHVSELKLYSNLLKEKLNYIPLYIDASWLYSKLLTSNLENDLFNYFDPWITLSIKDDINFTNLENDLKKWNSYFYDIFKDEKEPILARARYVNYNFYTILNSIIMLYSIFLIIILISLILFFSFWISKEFVKILEKEIWNLKAMGYQSFNISTLILAPLIPIFISIFVISPSIIYLILNLYNNIFSSIIDLNFEFKNNLLSIFIILIAGILILIAFMYLSLNQTYKRSYQSKKLRKIKVFKKLKFNLNTYIFKEKIYKSIAIIFVSIFTVTFINLSFIFNSSVDKSADLIMKNLGYVNSQTIYSNSLFQKREDKIEPIIINSTQSLNEISQNEIKINFSLNDNILNLTISNIQENIQKQFISNSIWDKFDKIEKLSYDKILINEVEIDFDLFSKLILNINNNFNNIKKIYINFEPYIFFGQNYILDRKMDSLNLSVLNDNNEKFNLNISNLDENHLFNKEKGVLKVYSGNPKYISNNINETLSLSLVKGEKEFNLNFIVNVSYKETYKYNIDTFYLDQMAFINLVNENIFNNSILEYINNNFEQLYNTYSSKENMPYIGKALIFSNDIKSIKVNDYLAQLNSKKDMISVYGDLFQNISILFVILLFVIYITFAIVFFYSMKSTISLLKNIGYKKLNILLSLTIVDLINCAISFSLSILFSYIIIGFLKADFWKGYNFELIFSLDFISLVSCLLPILIIYLVSFSSNYLTYIKSNIVNKI